MNEVDSTRLDQFRQIEKGIRGSRDYLIVGIDAAKHKNYAFYGIFYDRINHKPREFITQ
ncbi:MAG: hypothetical protein JRH09_11860 [Deltaproteobacteria bacterium]|nr:hypothetical protein [Deltaproteobacteria bacterium]